ARHVVTTSPEKDSPQLLRVVLAEVLRSSSRSIRPQCGVAAMTGAAACANRLHSWLGSATRPTTAAPMPLVSAVVTGGSAPPRRRATAVYAAHPVAAQRQPAAGH